MPIYCQIEDIMRIFQSAAGEKVRFSSTSLVGIRTGKLRNMEDTNIQRNLNMSFNYSLVQIAPSFAGDYVLKVYFEDSENFKVYRVDPKVHSEIFLSGGSVALEYTSPDGVVTIPAACWGGAIQTFDVLLLTLDGHISTDNGNLYIEDAEVLIDSMLEAAGIKFLLGGNARLFEVNETPEPIRISTAYLAAYLIYTDSFPTVMNDKEQSYSYPARWRKRAETLIKDYVTAKGLIPPKIYGLPAFIDRIGNGLVGPGFASKSANRGELNRPSGSESILDI